MFTKLLTALKETRRTIVFTEGTDARILEAADRLLKRDKEAVRAVFEGLIMSGVATEYTYNGESYNPNIESQYLCARYYDVVTATFITEDFYPQDMWALWNITEPLTLNRYNYCVSSPLNYVDPSGHAVEDSIVSSVIGDDSIPWTEKVYALNERINFYHTVQYISDPNANFGFVIDYDYEGDRDYLNEAYAKAAN